MDRIVEAVRRHPGVLIVVVAVSMAVAGAVYRSQAESVTSTSEQPASSGAPEDGSTEADEASGDPAERGGTEPQSEDGTSDGTVGSAGTPTSGGWSEDEATDDIPPDVARPRPDIDLGQPPDGSDVAEVARWWAAVYTAYTGAEPGEDLVDRLGEHTSDSLQSELSDAPPPASYGSPVAIDGASAGGPLVGEDQDEETERTVRVSVETPGALVVYDVVLVWTAGRWRVDDLEAL